MRWHVITGEYPPQRGGVSDYTREVARGLAAAGDQIEVWAPPCSEETVADENIQVHRLPDHFGARSIAIMQRKLKLSAGTRVLVQYVPHAYGWKAMNVPLCMWLAAHCRKSLSVMFHEVSYPITREQSLRHNLLGVVTRLMAWTIAGTAQDIMVATPAWERLLRPALRRGARVKWSPVPSNIPVVADPAGVDAIRSKFADSGGPLLGHFGTYGSLVADSLMQIFPILLSENRELPLLLVGRGSEPFRERLVRENPQVACRIYATGGLPTSDLSRHIAACDLFVQYYPDGVTCRRGSMMALLAHGRAVATTCGHLTENIWGESKAVAMAPASQPVKLAWLVTNLAGDEVQRHRFESAANALYDQRFDIRHTISALRCN